MQRAASHGNIRSRAISLVRVTTGRSSRNACRNLYSRRRPSLRRRSLGNSQLLKSEVVKSRVNQPSASLNYALLRPSRFAYHVIIDSKHIL